MSERRVTVTLKRVPWIERQWARMLGYQVPLARTPRGPGDWLGILVPYRFRRLHRLIAQSFGNFWLPCAQCGHEFGGHEWRDIRGRSSIAGDPAEPGGGRGICPRCTRRGRGGERP